MKTKFFMSAAVGVLATAATFGIANQQIGVKAAGKYDSIPELNEISSDSYITQIWTDQCGARRIDKRSVIVNDVSDWGFRAQIANRKFDLTSFNISLNAEKIGNEQAMMLIFGSSPGSYDGTDSKLIVMDIVKGRTESNRFIVTCSVGTNAHNISIPSFTDGGVWADDSNYKGVQVVTDNFDIDISFKKINETNTQVSVNEVAVNVLNSELYAPFVDDTTAYFALGLYNGGKASYPYIINSIGDASDDVYFSANGYFGKTESELNYLADLNLSGATVDAILAAKERYDAIPYSSLYSWDKAFLYTKWTEVTAKINQAVEDAGTEMSLVLFENNVAKLEGLCASLTSNDKIDEALLLCNECAEQYETLAADQTLDAGQQARLKAAYGKLTPCITTAADAAKDALRKGVKDYEDKFAAGINCADDVVELKSLKSAIPHQYNEIIGETEYAQLVEKINVVDAGIDAATTIVHQNWDQGVENNVVQKADNSIDFVTFGQCMGKSNEESSGIYNKEEISVVNFDMVVNFKYLPVSMGGWVSFGIMEKPVMWINAEDDSVQDNKGIFFLITRINSQTLGVQAFMCSMTSNRFYDSVLLQTIQIPQNQEITISFREVQKEIAGVVDTYFNMDFGGVSFDQTNITARKLKTVLMTKTGYFIMASSGYSSADPAVVEIKKINGYDPLNETIVKADAKDKTPTSTSKEATFVKGSEVGKPSFNLDTKDLAISSVTCDGNAVAASDYSYSNNKITFTNAFANSLAVGDHTIKVTTSGGSVQWTLHFVSGSDPEPEPEPKKGGCGGSIIATSAIITVLAVAGIGLVLRKKED